MSQPHGIDQGTVPFQRELQWLLHLVQVQEAMANVAMKSESSQPQAETLAQQGKSASVSTKVPKPATSAYKGIPLALLEKVTSHSGIAEKGNFTLWHCWKR